MKVHKNRFRDGWYTKLCDPTLYLDPKVTHFWSKVTCKRCLAKRGGGR